MKIIYNFMIRSYLGLILLEDPEIEKKVPYFWDLIAEYFTHE